MGHDEMSRPLAEARDYERRMESFVGEGERLCFHLTPRVGWMNDPNGFMFYQGMYHLFYQYNPYDTKWDTMHWGHAVSRDLLSWDYQPAALAPDQHYDDKGGCFSGSAAELPDGRQLLMYTGVGAGERKPDGTLADLQVQCLALGDGRDYVKYEGNPVIDASSLPEGCSSEHFRDPKLWQAADGSWRMVAASMDAQGLGQVVLYRSDDALSWEFVSVLAHNDGRFGRMWECPDLFALDGYDVLLLSPQDMLPEGHRFYSGNGTLCLMGHVDEQGVLAEESARVIDHGMDFYATQTTLAPDGRRVMVAWMQNWDCTTGVDPDHYAFGAMTVPRELSVRDGRLCQWPVRELDAWRRNPVRCEGVLLDGEPTALPGVSGRVVDLLVHVRPQDAERPYEEVIIWFAQNERFHCSLRYRPHHGTLKISRDHAGTRRAFVHHRKCDVQDATPELDLRIVLDKYSAEVFVNGGQQALTMIIPTDLTADGITFFARGGAVVDVEKYDLAEPTPGGAC